MPTGSRHMTFERALRVELNKIKKFVLTRSGTETKYLEIQKNVEGSLILKEKYENEKRSKLLIPSERKYEKTMCFRVFY
jgi:hypothetical protein